MPDRGESASSGSFDMNRLGEMLMAMRRDAQRMENRMEYKMDANARNLQNMESKMDANMQNMRNEMKSDMRTQRGEM